VHYVFPRRRLDVKKAVESLMEGSRLEMEERKGIIVVWDVAYDHLAGVYPLVRRAADLLGEIVEMFIISSNLPISFATIQKPSAIHKEDVGDKGKSPALRLIEPPEGVELKECLIWYLGEEGRSLLNLQMTHAGNPVCPVLNRAS
jgi:diphthamide biosynthesis protein 2